MADIKIEVRGFESEDETYQNPDGTLLKEIAGNNLITLSDVKMPFLQLKLLFNNPNTKLNSIASVFSPAPELVFVPSKTNMNAAEYLRGDTAFCNITVKNLSLHSAADSLLIDVNSDVRHYGQLQSDSEMEVMLPIETDNLTYYNAINLLLQHADLYQFNNTFSNTFGIIDDTIAP